MILLFRFGDLRHKMYILEKSKSSPSWPSTSFISLRDKSLFIAGGGRGGGEGMLYSYKAPFPCTILTPSIHPEKSPPTLSTLCLSCKQLFTVNVSFKWTTISCLLSGRPSFLSNLRNPGRMVPQQKPGDTVPIINTWSLFLFPPGNP